jgi:ribosomal protein S11
MTMHQWRRGGKKMTNSPMLTMADVGQRSLNQPGLEVVMRGYGPGREAFQKALLGQDGKDIRAYVWKVTDGTKLKFGGVRSRAVRRL